MLHASISRALLSLLLSVALLGIGAPSSRAQEDPLNAQAVPPPLPGQHVALRTIVTGVPDAKNPVGVIAIFYDGKVIRPRSPFNAPDDWLRHITISVRNESARTMIAGNMQLAFPGIGGDPMVVRYLRVGITPEHQRYTADGQKLHQIPGETAVAIAPRNYAKFSLASDYDAIQTEIERRAPIADVATLVVDYGAFYFEGDLRWMMNSFSKADPDAPGKYIPTAPEDFKTPLQDSQRVNYEG